MSPLHALSIGVCALTGVCFAGAMRWFFMPGRGQSLLRTGMAVSIYLCMLVQLLGVVWCQGVAPGYRLAGLLLFLSAHLLFWSAVAVHRKAPPAIAFSERPPRSLTTGGPYRLIRHPFYTSYLLAWLGGACAAGSAYLALAAAWMFVFYYLAAVREEAEMLASATFGAEYGRYRRRTGMFLPSLLRPAATPRTDR
jgi:protein-S-isoprenylcysteine O-methyltransferase Ste14